jgi:TRAP-type C4-dicarboxylate transport system permease small subunit
MNADQIPLNTYSISSRKYTIFAVIAVIMGVGIALVLGEIITRMIFPDGIPEINTELLELKRFNIR